MAPHTVTKIEKKEDLPKFLEQKTVCRSLVWKCAENEITEPVLLFISEEAGGDWKEKKSLLDLFAQPFAPGQFLNVLFCGQEKSSGVLLCKRIEHPYLSRTVSVVVSELLVKNGRIILAQMAYHRLVVRYPREEENFLRVNVSRVTCTGEYRCRGFIIDLCEKYFLCRIDLGQGNHLVPVPLVKHLGRLGEDNGIGTSDLFREVTQVA